MSSSTEVGSEPTVTAYISAKLADPGKIHRIRDDLYSCVGTNQYDLQDAHLTIIPSFELPVDEAPRIDKKLSQLNLPGQRVTINGVGVWPTIHNPRVVLLDCDVDLSETRATLLDALDQSNARDVPSPVPPHVTLFKCDNGHNIDEATKRTIQHELTSFRDTWETEIRFVDLIQPDRHD